MRLDGLDHVNIRCREEELPALAAFWSEVLGLRDGPRPAFDFPGAWLYAGDRPVVHLSGRVAARAAPATGPVDHVAFAASGLASARARLKAAGVAFGEQRVPGRALAQLFFSDPAGTRIELLFDLAHEGLIPTPVE